MSNNNEILLIANLIEGNHESFEQLFNTYYQKIYNYANEFVADYDIAREISQETFVKLWENKEALNDNTNISAYLYTIARNISLNFLKQKTMQLKHKENIKDLQLINQLNYLVLKDEISEKIIYKELEDKINLSIDKLPEKCKEVFRLSRMNGLKHKEIAKILNIAVKTVENHIKEALKKIRKDIEPFI